MAEKYSLATGASGRRRLEILNEAMWPHSRRLLRAAGLRKGMSFLDVGCGVGALTARVADLGVDAVGVDANEGFIQAARRQHPSIRFEQMDVRDLAFIERKFDLVYARYLLSHLADPAAAIVSMLSVTKPGGRIVLEDIDFDLHVAEPRTAEFDRYLEWYEAVVRRRGGDPYLGRRLYRLALDAGLDPVRASVQVTLLPEGETKRISSLTLDGIKEALVAEGMASAEEIEKVLAELRELEDDRKSLISGAGTHQVWGRVG